MAHLWLLLLLLAAMPAHCWIRADCPGVITVVENRPFNKDIYSFSVGSVTGVPENRIDWNRPPCARDNRIKTKDDYIVQNDWVGTCVRANGLGDQTFSECRNRFNTLKGAQEGRDVNMLIYNWHVGNYQKGNGMGEMRFTGAAKTSITRAGTWTVLYEFLKVAVEHFIRAILGIFTSHIVPVTWTEFQPLSAAETVCSLVGDNSLQIRGFMPDGFQRIYTIGIRDDWLYLTPKSIGFPALTVSCTDNSGTTQSASGYVVRISTQAVSNCVAKFIDTQEVGMVYKYSTRTVKYYKWMNGLQPVESKSYYFSVFKDTGDAAMAFGLQLCRQNQAMISNTRSTGGLNVSARLEKFWDEEPDIESIYLSSSDSQSVASSHN